MTWFICGEHLFNVSLLGQHFIMRMLSRVPSCDIPDAEQYVADVSVWSCQQASHAAGSGVHHLAEDGPSIQRIAVMNVGSVAIMPGTVIGTAGDTLGESFTGEFQF